MWTLLHTRKRTSWPRLSAVLPFHQPTACADDRFLALLGFYPYVASHPYVMVAFRRFRLHDAAGNTKIIDANRTAEGECVAAADDPAGAEAESHHAENHAGLRWIL